MSHATESILRTAAAACAGSPLAPVALNWYNQLRVTEVLYYAIPFFVLLLIAEAVSFRHVHDDEDLIGYELADTRTSLAMGMGNVVINVGWKAVVVLAYAAVYELTPLRLDPHDWWVWVALFGADDVSYYWFHRISHESRVFWASHVVHHSIRALRRQLPTVFRVGIKNSGTSRDAFAFEFTDVPFGFTAETGVPQIEIPPGETAEVSVVLRPSGELPAPGTNASFTLRVASTSNPAIAASANRNVYRTGDPAPSRSWPIRRRWRLLPERPLRVRSR